MNNELISRVISYNYNELGEEFGDCIVDMKKEIERLKQGYCELKEKCNKGECDCTNEEYDNM